MAYNKKGSVILNFSAWNPLTFFGLIYFFQRDFRAWRFCPVRGSHRPQSHQTGWSPMLGGKKVLTGKVRSSSHHFVSKVKYFLFSLYFGVFLFRFKYLFVAGEHCDDETRVWAEHNFKVLRSERKRKFVQPTFTRYFYSRHLSWTTGGRRRRLTPSPAPALALAMTSTRLRMSRGSRFPDLTVKKHL